MNALFGLLYFIVLGLYIYGKANKQTNAKKYNNNKIVANRSFVDVVVRLPVVAIVVVVWSCFKRCRRRLLLVCIIFARNNFSLSLYVCVYVCVWIVCRCRI